jgi:hypothetical protein
VSSRRRLPTVYRDYVLILTFMICAVPRQPGRGRGRGGSGSGAATTRRSTYGRHAGVLDFGAHHPLREPLIVSVANPGSDAKRVLECRQEPAQCHPRPLRSRSSRLCTSKDREVQPHVMLTCRPGRNGQNWAGTPYIPPNGRVSVRFVSRAPSAEGVPSVSTMEASALAAAAVRPVGGGLPLFCCPARPRQAATPKRGGGGEPRDGFFDMRHRAG